MLYWRLPYCHGAGFMLKVMLGGDLDGRGYGSVGKRVDGNNEFRTVKKFGTF